MKQPSVHAGQPSAAVCKSRPSRGQAEPLCYPLLPSPRFLFAPSFFVLFSFSLKATPTFQICALLSGSSPCSVSPNGKQNSEKKKLPPLVALRATYNAEPLSKLLSFPLPPSFPATVGEELSLFLSFSSPCLALPLPLTI